MTLEQAVVAANKATMKKEGVCVPQDSLRKALKADHKLAGRYPTDAELWAMVDHNDEDEDEETPADVRKNFPQTTEELESAWQIRGGR
jgi:hypothetical protein